MIKTQTIRALIALFFTFIILSISNAQNYFSKRIDVAGKVNLTSAFLFINDTFYITNTIYEVPYSQASTALLKVDKWGILITAKRFKPSNKSYFGGGGGIYARNNKIYTTGLTDWGYQIQQGLYTFNTQTNNDTVFTRSYGDTAYYNYVSTLLPYLKAKNKLLLFGITDSTCGPAHSHPGYYKPEIRVVDTNGVLYQTKLYTTTNVNRGVADADTTLKKGYVYSGIEIYYYNGNNYAKNYVTKLDSNLNEQWHIIIDTGYSVVNSIISLKSGKLLFAYNYTENIVSNTYFYDKITLTKLDINGNIIWTKRYGNAATDVGVYRVRECMNGDFILCGVKRYNYNSTVSQVMGWLMRTDSVGNLKWWKTYIPLSPIRDTTCYNEFYDVTELPNKDIAVVGSAGGSSLNSLIQQTWLLKVDSNGCFGPGNCPANIAVGIKDNGTATELLSNNIKIYPNPANEMLNVEFKMLNGDNAKLEIINSVGQVVQTTQLLNQTTVINTKELSNGLYFITLKTGTTTLTKKIVIQR